MDLGPWGTIIFMQLIWVFLECFLDWVGILFLTVPLFLPIVLKKGFDNVWLGVVFFMNTHISYFSPCGFNLIHRKAQARRIKRK